MKLGFPVLMVVLVALAGVVHAGGATGVILSVDGNAIITSGGTNIAVKAGVSLKTGDVLKVSSGAVKLLLSNGKIETVKPGVNYLAANEPGVDKPGVGSRVVEALAEVMRKDGAPTVAGMVRTGSNEIESLYPRNTMVAENELKFQWKTREDIGKVVVVIKALSPAYQHVLKPKADETTIVLPADAPKLQPGVKYYWKVIDAESAGIPSAESSVCWFGVIGADDSKALDEGLAEIGKTTGIDEGNRVLMRSALLLSYQLHARALAELDAGIKAHPRDEAIRAMLENLRRQMDEPADPKK